MADDPNIQKLIFPVNTSTPGIVRTYTAEVNKKTGAMVVYDTTNLFQKDPILRDELTQTETEKVWLPSFLQDDLSNDEKDFILRSVRPQANNQRAAYINKNFTQEQKNNLFPGMPRVVNTAPPAPEITSGGTTVGADGEQQANLSEAIENLGRINDVEAKEFGELRYPIGSDTNGQDYIQFTVFEYLPQERSESNLTYNEKNTFSGKEKGLGRIFLPIQPTIMDTNSVSWGEDKFGILEMIGANLSLGAMTGDSATELAGKFAETVTSSENKIDPKIVSAVQTYLAKMAVSSNNNLLSRLTGAVTNPNLTLLFNSPELRNFNFNFKLTPRTQSEGTEVRKIIRVFKQYMAVQRSAGNLFLEAPCIFKIRYIRGVDRFNKEKDLDHPALNRIKTCALRNFSVNYTPAGSYATYNDKAGTMSSYDLTMSFTELEPVYWDNYNEIPEDQIGY